MTNSGENDTQDVHEMWLAPEFEDGERGNGVSGHSVPDGSIAVEQLGDGQYRCRPAAEVIGWRVICDCYTEPWQMKPTVWVAPQLWKRVPSKSLENLYAAKIFAADTDVVDVGWREDVQDAMRAYWRREHMAEAEAFGAVRAASRSVKEASAALSEAVAAARGAGLSWSKIGEAAEMSGQSAHERWSKRGETAARKGRVVKISDLGPHE